MSTTSTTAPGPLRLIAAPFTAFGPDGTLDLDAVPDQIRLLRQGGVAGAFVCGTTGECGSLTLAERERVAERWAAEAGGSSTPGASSTPGGSDESSPAGDPGAGRPATSRTDGRFQVIVHVGHSCLEDARRLAAHAAGLNVAGIASVAPYYHRPAGVGDLVDWCARVAAAAPELPFFYYHIPSLTGVDLPMDEFLAVAAKQIPTFAGIKFTHHGLGELARCLEAAREAPGSPELLFGRDEMLLPALSLGVRAAVGSTYNFAAPLYLRVARALCDGDLDTARAAQATARRMIETAGRFGGQPAMKAVAGMVGRDLGPCRPPMRPLDAEQRARLGAELEGDGFVTALADATLALAES